jgi:uncharacterized protein (TIGR00369 family)
MDDFLEALGAVNNASPFDRWAGVRILSAAKGQVSLEIEARPDLLQHSGFLHAGIEAALIDRACGFAAATLAGNVVTAQFAVRCFKPATGERFRCDAEVVRAGKRQVFAEARLFAIAADGSEALVGAGDALLTVLS